MIGGLLSLADAARDRARRKRWTPEQAAGRRGEDLAHRYLERQGLLVVARNWRPSTGAGEVDLIAREGDTLAVVEVKSRTDTEYGDPDRNIDAVKRETLVRAARNYARRAGIPWDRVRFDLVSVVLRQPPEIRHLRDAFRAGRTL